MNLMVHFGKLLGERIGGFLALAHFRFERFRSGLVAGAHQLADFLGRAIDKRCGRFRLDLQFATCDVGINNLIDQAKILEMFPGESVDNTRLVVAQQLNG